MRHTLGSGPFRWQRGAGEPYVLTFVTDELYSKSHDESPTGNLFNF